MVYGSEIELFQGIRLLHGVSDSVGKRKLPAALFGKRDEA